MFVPGTTWHASSFTERSFDSVRAISRSEESMRIHASATVMALILSVAGIASAQVTNTGTISVIVADTAGGRMPGVSVTASAPDTITTRTAVTDAEGVAVLEALAPSNQYKVVGEIQGFTTATRDRI